MTHKTISAECEALGLTVTPQPDTGRKSYSATGNGVRVYWSTSYEGGLLGLPRVIVKGADHHARSVKEIHYLATL